MNQKGKSKMEGRETELRLYDVAKVVAAGVPKCPKCGKPMRKMIAKKGRNAGNPFWSYTGYPDCDGTRNYVEVERGEMS